MFLQSPEVVKTTTPFQKPLLDEIDRINPFKTRREFFEEACRRYLKKLNRDRVYQQLGEACRDSVDKDLLENADWETTSKD